MKQHNRPAETSPASDRRDHQRGGRRGSGPPLARLVVRAAKSGAASLAAVVLLATATPPAGAHGPQGHVIAGLGQTSAGALRIAAPEQPDLYGSASYTPSGKPTVEITLSCVHVELLLSAPPSALTPEHVLDASGTGDDGLIYYLTLTDRTLGDSFRVSATNSGAVPCGGPAGELQPVSVGAFTISP